MPALQLQSSNVFSYTFAGAGNTHAHNIQIANSAANPVLNLGGQSFTIECWLKPQNRGINGLYASIFSKRRGLAGADASYQGYLDGTTGALGYYNGTNYLSSTRLAPNTWNHVAWVFNQGANVRIFVNGANVITNTAVTAVSNVDTPFYIGYHPGAEASQYFGEISNFRVIRGQAIYSGNFQISTHPFQLPNNDIGPHAGSANVAASLTGNVVLLTCNDDILSVDGNSKSVLSGNTFINGTVYPHAVDPLEMTEYSYNNLGQSTVNVNTSKSFILSTDSSNLNLASGDFTLEFWVYMTTGFSVILNKGGAANIAWPSYVISVQQGNVYFGGSNTNARIDIGSDGSNGVGGNVHRGYISAFSMNTWNHIAVTRSGSTYYGFCNGVLGYTETTANTPYNSTGRGLTILGWIDNASNTWTGGGVAGQTISGHISNIRLVTGRALYTANFTPPKSPLGFIPGTQLLTAKSSSLVDLAGSVTLAANGMGSIGISTFNPFTSNTITNANATTLFTRNYSTGFEISKVYNKFDYSNFGQMINIYPTLAQEQGRIYDKFDVGAMAIPASPSAITVGQDQGRIYDKSDLSVFAIPPNSAGYTVGDRYVRIYNKFDYQNFGQMVNIYSAVGSEQTRIYNKFDYRNFGQMVNIYTVVGQEPGRVYAKFWTQNDYAYIPVGGGGGGGTGNVEYQFWS